MGTSAVDPGPAWPRHHATMWSKHNVDRWSSWAFAPERRLGNDDELRPLKYISHCETAESEQGVDTTREGENG